MNRIIFSLICIVLATLLASCECCSTGYFIGRSNRNKMQSLRVGMTKDETLKIMGKPLTEEIYNKPNLWYYYTNVKWSDFRNTRDECTPVVFKDGKILGWGVEYYKRNYEFKDWEEESLQNAELKAADKKLNKLAQTIDKQWSKKKTEKSMEKEFLQDLDKNDKAAKP